MKITKKEFGEIGDGKYAEIFSMENSKGIFVEITNFGATIVTVKTPDRNGLIEDITLGYNSLEGYLENEPYMGSIIGRVANRIEDAFFEIEGTKYFLKKNDGENHLHGGLKGYNKVLWNASVIKNENSESLMLEYHSADGEEGYPGNLDVKVLYSLSENNELSINYSALSDKDTPVNLTNHAYFNLSGHDSGDIKSHFLKINSDFFTPVNKKGLPYGEIKSVKNTVMDFKTSKLIGNGLDSDDIQIAYVNGYDHNWIINEDEGKNISFAAEVYEKKSGRTLEVYTTKPGIQFYSGNFLNVKKHGKNGACYHKHSGLCLETQFFPNSLKCKNFPSIILKAGEKYRHTTIYKFLVK